MSGNLGVHVFISVKAPPKPPILKILNEEGCGADCSSLSELIMSERCGITGENIMFSSNATPAEEFVKAKQLGAIINLDDYTHVEFLKNTCGIPEKISCRYKPGGYFSIANQIMDNPQDAQYGMTQEQMIQAYKDILQLVAKEFGIHAFLASNTISNEYYPTLASILFKLAVELRDKTGANIKFINLSGGIGIPYRPDEPENDIDVIGEAVRNAV